MTDDEYEIPDDIAELLDQGEIDMLMDEASTPRGIGVFRYTGDRFPRGYKVDIEDYDFRNPVFLTETELRQVRLRHESFIHYLAARLSMFLRMDFTMSMKGLHTSPYHKFTEAIPNPTHISLFKIDQLAGVGVLDINPRLALTIVNRMLGGKGNQIQEERILTEIEQVLMDDIVQIIMEEWCKQWEEIQETSVSLLGRENDGRFLQTAPADSIMLILDVHATLGDCSDLFQIAVPYYMIEPIIKEMQAKSRKFSKMGTGNSTEKKPRWLDAYSKVNVHVSAEWKAFSMTVRDLISLQVGDILELPGDITSQTVLRVNNSKRFKGEIGVVDGQVALEIREQADEEI